MTDYKLIYQIKEGTPFVGLDEIEKVIKRIEELLNYNDIKSVQIPVYMNAILIDSDGRAVHL